MLVVGGFQTPLERELLAVLLRGSGPVTICPARNIEGMRIPAAWRQPIADGRLSISSTFPANLKRATRASGEKRNEYVVELAAAVLVIHASPGGSTERAVKYALELGKPVLTLDSPDNQHLIDLGAQPITPQTAVATLQEL